MSIPPRFIRPRVLVVDDSRTVRESVLQQLRDRFDVRLEDDGEAAWEAVRRDPTIRAVVADLSMPRLDGYGLLERIRSSRESRIRNTPVIIMSVNDGDAEYAAAKALGAIGFVSKSRVRAVLASRLESLLSMAPGAPLSDTQAFAAQPAYAARPSTDGGGTTGARVSGAEDTHGGLRPPFALPRRPGAGAPSPTSECDGPPTVPLHDPEPLELNEVVAVASGSRAAGKAAAPAPPGRGTDWIDLVLDTDSDSTDAAGVVMAHAGPPLGVPAFAPYPTGSMGVSLPVQGPVVSLSPGDGALTGFGRFVPRPVDLGQVVVHFRGLDALDGVIDARPVATRPGDAATATPAPGGAATDAQGRAADAQAEEMSAPAADGPLWPPAAPQRDGEFSVVRAVNMAPWGTAAARAAESEAARAGIPDPVPDELPPPRLQGVPHEPQQTPSHPDDTAPSARAAAPVAARAHSGQENSMSRFDTLNKVLKNLQTESPGVQASALISEDGLMIASALAQDMDETRVAGMTATLLNLGTRAATELRRGDVKEVIVRGEQGYAVMINAGRGALLLVLASESTPLGLIFFDMREAIKAIKTIL